MVLRAVALVLVAGCNQSLFDSHGTTPPDGTGPTTCPDGCIGDAGGDFDGTPTGSRMRWRYLEDHRDRTWAAMTPDGDGMVGADPNNAITSCAKHGAVACDALPGALLMSSAGATTGADPAIELTAPNNQVIQLTLHAFTPSGSPDQTIRIYRNSREDVLFTGKAAAGATLDQVITLDALEGDRFLVALAPDTAGATDVGIQLFANTTGAVFPSTCQVALPFSVAGGFNVDNQCNGSGPFTHHTTDTPTAPVLGAGPFAEQGMGADLATDTYYDSMGVLDLMHDVTIQLWMKTRTVDQVDAGFAFSDADLDLTGGIGIDVFFDAMASAPRLEVFTCTDAGNPLMFANTITAWPTDQAWRFVRVVHTGGMVNVCVDGKRTGGFPLADGKLQSSYPAYVGKDVVWTPSGSFFDGQVDDVRVITGALPCE